MELELTLQPFVENAVIHGFYDRTSGHLAIHAFQEEHDLVFIITDNGVGLQFDWDQRVENKGGYGIGNVKERLNAFLVKAYGVSISGRP